MQNSRILIYMALIWILSAVIASVSAQDPSTFAFRINGHKHNMDEDYVERAIQEAYDRVMDSIDFSALVDSMGQVGFTITEITPPEDVTLTYEVDTAEVHDFMWEISLADWTILFEGQGCEFTSVISGIGFRSGGTSQFNNGEFRIELSESAILEPQVNVDATGQFWCDSLEDTLEVGLLQLIGTYLDPLAAAFDSTNFGAALGFANLVTAFGIEDSTLVEAALESFPLDMTLVTESDEELGITQLIHEIDFLSGTTTDSTAFWGIEPDEIPGSQLTVGGFSFLYHQLQGGFRWHEDWTASQRVDAAFGIMDSLDINGYRIEANWRRIQTKAYTGEGLNPEDITPDQIEVFLADSDHWDGTAFDDIQAILDDGYVLGLTPFMAIGVGHEDRMPVDDMGLRIAPATAGWVPTEGYTGVSADVYLYNLKIYAHATVRRLAEHIDVWQAENELNAAGFAAADPDWWRKGDLWLDPNFRDQVMAVLVEAIRIEDPSASITHDLHMLGFMQALESWVEDLDIVGFNFYPNQTMALPVMGFSVGEYAWAVRRALKGLGYPEKPIWLIETGYPGIERDDAPDTLLLAEDGLYFSESRQQEYVQTALASAVENGVTGFFYFSLTAEEEIGVGGGGAPATFMRFSGLIRRDTDEPKLALRPYAQLYNELVTAVANGVEQSAIPQSLTLYQNYPNPFNLQTTIRFELPWAGNVKLVVFDIRGRQIVRLAYGFYPPGYHRVQWDASNVASGTYLYQLTANHAQLAKKLLVLK